MLRESSQTQQLVDNLDLSAVADATKDSGVAHGTLLIRFAEAVLGDDEAELDAIRHDVRAALGPQALVDASAIVATFMQMVRIADATGIAVVGPMLDKSHDFRHELGLHRFASARNTLSQTAT